jgi:hypothetical protein
MCGPTADEVWTAVNACRETPTCIAPTAASFIAWYASSVRPVAEVEKPLRKEIKQLNGALADESNVVMAQKDSLSAANARLAELEKCRPVCWTEEKMRTVVAAEIKKGGYAETARRVTEQRHIDGKPFFEDWCLETAIRTLADLIPKPISRGRGKSDKYMAALQRLIETYPKSFIELPELPKIVFDLLVLTDEFAWGPLVKKRWAFGRLRDGSLVKAKVSP